MPISASVSLKTSNCQQGSICIVYGSKTNGPDVIEMKEVYNTMEKASILVHLNGSLSAGAGHSGCTVCDLKSDVFANECSFLLSGCFESCTHLSCKCHVTNYSGKLHLENTDGTTRLIG